MRVFVTGTRVHIHLTVSRSPLDPLSYQLLYSLTYSSLHQSADLFIKTVEWNYLLKTLMLLMDLSVRRWSGKDSHKTERVAPILNHTAFCVSDFMSVKQKCLPKVRYIPVIMELDTSVQACSSKFACSGPNNKLRTTRIHIHISSAIPQNFETSKALRQDEDPFDFVRDEFLSSKL